MHPSGIAAIFTDLDGTLLNSARQVTRVNLDCLQMLGRAGVARVIATGRSVLSYRRVLGPEFPADYLIFSSGAGIMDLASGTLLQSNALEPKDVGRITATLESHKADYMVHAPVPANHHFTYPKANPENKDFTRRIELYRDYASDFAHTGCYPQKSAQIIAVLNKDAGHFQQIRKDLNGYQVTRTTSPLDHQSIWMEIYPENVHKGSAAAWLCRHLGIAPRNTLSVGNDYNDLDLLDFTRHSYLVANAPADLHGRYRMAPTNDQDGFRHAVHDAFGRIQPR